MTVCSYLPFTTFNYLGLQTKCSEFKDLENCSYQGHFGEDAIQFSWKTELGAGKGMENQRGKPWILSVYFAFMLDCALVKEWKCYFY